MSMPFDRSALLLTSTGPVTLQLMEADTAATRLRGLMGRAALRLDANATQGLLLRRCRSVHGCFIAAALDLVYLDRAGQVTQTAQLCRFGAHWAAGGWRGSAVDVLELPAGSVKLHGIEPGDWLLVLEAERVSQAWGPKPRWAAAGVRP